MMAWLVVSAVWVMVGLGIIRTNTRTHTHRDTRTHAKTHTHTYKHTHALTHDANTHTRAHARTRTPTRTRTRPGQYSRMSFSSDQATGTVFPHLNMPFLQNSEFI